jgi:hypothetical protein
MRKIAQKNEVSIMKLSARRGLECRILHHLSQSFWGPWARPLFLIFSTIVQDKRPFFTTFDYIVAVIQALQFVDYKDVLRFYFFNAI